MPYVTYVWWHSCHMWHIFGDIHIICDICLVTLISHVTYVWWHPCHMWHMLGDTHATCDMFCDAHVMWHMLGDTHVMWHMLGDTHVMWHMLGDTHVMWHMFCNIHIICDIWLERVFNSTCFTLLNAVICCWFQVRVLRRQYAWYLYKNTIVFTILHSIAWTRFHPSRIIITGVTLYNCIVNEQLR